MSFTYLSDILHVVAQALLAPDIILLLALILYALFSIGSVVVEYFTERKHFQVVMPKFLAALMAANEEDIPQIIADSGLLKRQKVALYTVYEYRALPGDALVALVRRLVNEEETRYDRITGRNNMAAKVSPMLGLMGTLIPLGPGIQALGTADTAALSSSLLVAFDTTVAGLVTAAVCLVIGKIRNNWYDNYLSALDASMATMMEKIESGRETSTATLPDGTSEPTDYSFLFGGNVTADAEKALGQAEAIATTTVTESAAARKEPASPELPAAPAELTSPELPATPVELTSPELPTTPIELTPPELSTTPAELTPSELPTTPTEPTSSEQPSTPDLGQSDGPVLDGKFVETQISGRPQAFADGYSFEPKDASNSDKPKSLF